MRSLLLFLVVLAAFAATAFGALQLMDSGDAPAAVANEPSNPVRTFEPAPVATKKPTVASKPRKSAAERSGDRWVNQAEAICRTFEDRVKVLVANATPRTQGVALYRKAYRYEREAVTGLHALKRPKGPDRPLVDRLLKVLDRHLAVFDALLDSIESRDGRSQQFANKLIELAEPTEQAAAELGAFTCAYGG